MTDFNSITERLLTDAGIVPEMRVIDIGCGSGEVSLLLRRLVGESGQVIGIDQDARVLTIASERAQEQNFHNVSFLQADLATPMSELTSFDALVGRRVLMYLADPVSTIQNLADSLKTGGIAVFQESDSTMVPGRKAPLPLHDQVISWMWQTVEREGANIHMGVDLPSVLEQAGLAIEHVRAEAVIQGQGTHYPLSYIIRAMLPRITKHGVATESEIDIETLEQRLAAERASTKSAYVSDMAFGVWARKL